jgi:two-component system, sensor histidine kinase PdtaS
MLDKVLKINIVLFFILGNITTVKGQQDSIINTSIKEAIALFYNEPDSAMAILNNHKELILQEGTALQKIDMYLTFFRLYYYVKKNLQEAKRSLRKAELVSKANGNLKLSIIYQNFGRYYHRAETQLDSSLYYHLAATDIENKIPDNYELNYHYSDLAELYLTLQDVEKSIFYIEKALEIVRSGKKRMDYGYILHNAIKLYEIAGDSAKLKLANKEYEDFKALGKNTSAVVHANTPFNPNKVDKKTDFQNKISKNDSLSNTTRSLTYRLMLADEYLRDKKSKDAIDVLLSGLPMMDDTTVLFQHNFHIKLKRAYYQDKQYEKAYEHAQIVALLNEKLLNEQKISAIEELEAKYEKLENEKLIGDLQKEKKLAYRNNMILALLLILAIVTILAVMRINRINSNNISQLEGKNIIITEMLKEKDFLIKEIHHRVKNNLQVISSLLQLQARYIDEPSAQEALSDGESRVRSMALIHQHLYTGTQLAAVNIQDYIENLVDNLKLSYKDAHKKIFFNSEIEEIELDINQMIPLGLIINELLVNAYKYAFENREHGKIDLLIAIKNNKVCVSIADNGVGIAERSHSGGFGTRLIQSFVKKLNAEYKITSAPNEGTRIDIEFSPELKADIDKKIA